MASPSLLRDPTEFAELQRIFTLRARLWKKSNSVANLFIDAHTVTSSLYELDSMYRTNLTVKFLSDTFCSRIPRSTRESLQSLNKRNALVGALGNFVLALWQIKLDSSMSKQPSVIRALELVWESLEKAFASDKNGAIMIEKWKGLFNILSKPLNKIVKDDATQLSDFARACKPMPKMNTCDAAVKRTFEYLDLMVQRSLHQVN